ncbi:MAG TPA: ATP-binding cassette domain-containing protein [Ohtaekwangia sp.]|uniref:ABC transporter ATP-binding protein n=1 Tax=Ohtaekwangia sp. TaxID=2066019 RepID=UPI002F9222FB
MLRLEHFRKTYGNTPVLTIDALTLDRSIYWIKGINGSGKSTLLKTMAGILAFEGNIVLNGTVDIRKQPVHYRKRVNFAEAEPLFPPFLTGYEMIRLFAAAKDATTKYTIELLERMNMHEYIQEPISIYSSGMIKKLSLALALTGTPDVVLLDEPLITMDEASLGVLYECITEKYTREGTSFLLSSHQPLTHSLPPVKELLVHNGTVTCEPI